MAIKPIVDIGDVISQLQHLLSCKELLEELYHQVETYSRIDDMTWTRVKLLIGEK